MSPSIGRHLLHLRKGWKWRRWDRPAKFRF
jgi:hypothetical protein